MAVKAAVSPCAANFQALSLFRATFAAYLLAEFFVNDVGFFSDFYGGQGLFPASSLTGGEIPSAFIKILTFLERPEPTTLIEYLYPISLGCLLLGYKTRTSNAVAFSVKA